MTEVLSEVNPNTRRAYWRHVLKQAFLLCIKRGLPLFFAILIAMAIVVYQQFHHVTFEHDGWFAVLKPYVIELAAWCVFLITEACWRTHLATQRRFQESDLVERLNDAKLLEQNSSASTSPLWEQSHARWVRETIRQIAAYRKTDMAAVEREFLDSTGTDADSPIDHLRRQMQYLKKFLPLQ